MKTCSRCRETKPLSEFGKDKNRPDGHNTWCKPCRRTYRQTVRKKKNQKAQKERSQAFLAWLSDMVRGKPCTDCGEVYAFHVMEFDHVRGTKRYNIGKMANHSRERVLEEIAKCDLVCCACHRIRSHTRRDPPRTPRLIAYREWMADLKANPCKDCGRTLRPEAMDFDHIQGEKDTQISDMWSYSRERVVAELEKCELVCANCHRERTWRRLRGAPGDGRPLTCVSCGEDVWGYSGKAGNVKCDSCRKTPLMRKKGKDTDTHVSCRICGIQRRRLDRHIRSAHGMSTDEYLEQFPDARVFIPMKKSAETRAKQAAAARKRWADPEERQKQSERLRESAPWKGKKLSGEHVLAISRGLLSSDKRIGRPPSG